MPDFSNFTTTELLAAITDEQNEFYECREECITELAHLDRRVPETEEVAKFRGGIRPTRPNPNL